MCLCVCVCERERESVNSTVPELEMQPTVDDRTTVATLPLFQPLELLLQRCHCFNPCANHPPLRPPPPCAPLYTQVRDWFRHALQLPAPIVAALHAASVSGYDFPELTDRDGHELDLLLTHAQVFAELILLQRLEQACGSRSSAT